MSVNAFYLLVEGCTCQPEKKLLEVPVDGAGVSHTVKDPQLGIH